MFYIGLSSKAYDPTGVVLIPARDSDISSVSRRVTRTATLDGGASIVNRGYSPADRTLKVSLRFVQPPVLATAIYLLKTHGQLVISLPDGCFTGTASSFNQSNQTLEVLLTGAA